MKIFNYEEFILLHLGAVKLLLINPVDLKIRQHKLTRIMNGENDEADVDEAKNQKNKKRKKSELKLAKTYCPPVSYIEKGRSLGKPIGN